MRRLDAGLKDAWSLAAPFWRSEHRWRALLLLAVIVSLNLGLVVITVVLTYWQRAFFNALEAKDWSRFIGLLLWGHGSPQDGFMLGFSVILLVFVIVTVYALYLRQALQIRWRRWLTDRFLDDWLSGRAYLGMARDRLTDNPDQRIAEDVRLFVDNTLVLGLGLMRSVASLLSFVVLLWTLSETVVWMGVTIHGYLVWVALLYAGLGTGLAHVVGRRLIPLHFAQQRVEADFRFSLMRLSEHAEGIAFHGGEAEQRRELSGRFAMLIDNWQGIMQVTRRLTFLTSAYGQVVLVFPLAVTAPAYFAGRMPLGGIFQASNAFVQVQSALSWIVENYSVLTEWLATVDRLAGFRRSVDAIHRTPQGLSVVDGDADRISLDGVDLALPDGSPLLKGVDLQIMRGRQWLIRGPSGSGKSSLFRALAGLWPFGSGTIQRASGTRLFMPQRPYMPLGTLKRAVCYPLAEADVADAVVANTLNAVGLGHLVPALATTDTWERRLSGGEQQRLTAARALLLRPDWLFLDEATSALDPQAEVFIYGLLRERLPGTTFVSIVHRLDLERFHTDVLHLSEGRVRTAAL